MDKHPLQKMIEDTGIGEVRWYSGRGMYGKECLGVTLSRGEFGYLLSELMKLCIDADPDNEGETENAAIAAEAVKDMNWDSMGHDTIAYWPAVHFTPELQDFKE